MGSSKPQQPERSRSGHTPVTKQDHAPEELQARDQPGTGAGLGPVPEDNRPGNRPAKEQDKPGPERFRERLTGQDDTSQEGGAATPAPEVAQAATNANPSDSRSHLYELAQRLGVPGRSRMGKRELAQALHQAGRQRVGRRDAR